MMMTVMIMMTVTAEESVKDSFKWLCQLKWKFVLCHLHFEVGKYAHLWGQTTDDVHSMGSFLSSSSIWVLLLSVIILVVPIEEIEITLLESARVRDFDTSW